jgi:hypothetical protein
MRKLIFLVTILGLSLGSQIRQAQAVGLTFVPALQDVNIGDTAVVDLQVVGVGDHTSPSLGGFDVTVNFDSSILSFVGATFGGLLGDIGLGEATTITTPGAGVVNLYELSFLEGNVAMCLFCVPPYLNDLQASSFVIASLSFQAIAGGSSALSLSNAILADENGDELSDPDLLGAVINVRSDGGGGTVVPEPSTFVLLGSCMLALVLHQYRTTSVFSDRSGQR